MSSYRDIVIETYNGRLESSTSAPSARPLPGQGVSTALKVECSGSMRKSYPVGTKFLIKAKLSEAYGTTFLYSSYRWPYEVLSTSAAKAHIEGQN